jgi:hypothetical protein
LSISLLPDAYKILSNILLSSSSPYADKIIGIISVDFDVIYQLLIINTAFVKRKNGNTMGQYISYL